METPDFIFISGLQQNGHFQTFGPDDENARVAQMQVLGALLLSESFRLIEAMGESEQAGVLTHFHSAMQAAPLSMACSAIIGAWIKANEEKAGAEVQ